VAGLDCDDGAIVLERRSNETHASSDTPAAPPELSHAEVRDRLSAHFEDSLSVSEARQVERHLAHCADCRAFANTLRQTIQGLRSLGPGPAPADAKRRLRERTAPAATQHVR
jgi:anti-sigma factor RsiW